jgi:hypothetical protein
MRREPSLTFQGALEILGRYEPTLIKRLDQILGGVILAAGAGAGLAAIGGAGLAPLGMFAAVWGWTDQKSEALSLLGDAIGRLSGKLAGTQGYERFQLIGAAHTVIVLAAFFEGFQEVIGKDIIDRLVISDAQKLTWLAREGQHTGEVLFESLYAAEVPAPSVTRGFEENVKHVELWATEYSRTVTSFLRGLLRSESNSQKEAPGDSAKKLNEKELKEKELNGKRLKEIDKRAVKIPEKVGGCYRSHFLMLAERVPEFMIWSMLGEHAATRSVVRNLSAHLATALQANRDALGRIESLLAAEPSGVSTPERARTRAATDLRAILARANRSFLAQPIVPDAERTESNITFPSVSHGYINPRFKVKPPDQPRRMASSSRDIEAPTAEQAALQIADPADEGWWERQPSGTDFDLVLAAHVSSPNATRFPLLLLGHPGAGKSMLTKVFAARLSASGYTVVRVPLRSVAAGAPLLHQIEEALDQTTNGRITQWWELSQQSRDTIRVVLLDGLDELLQASDRDRSYFLSEVAEFQQKEAEQELPVIVIVTSRTVVADRVDIPAGAAVLKLEPFGKDDIAAWLDRWREANAAEIAKGHIRALTTSAALRQPELARQPLLLLMLALYAADPSSAPLDAGLSTAELYEHLLTTFARREALKDPDLPPRSPQVAERVRDHLDRLETAALAMFNRGRQDISEDDLIADLAALAGMPPDRARFAEAGQRIIAQFFFIHASEAYQRGSAQAGQDVDSGGQAVGFHTGQQALPDRSYEFLHATFGEYLVARRIMAELADAAAKTFAGRRGLLNPESDLLFALLCHRPLAVRKSVLTFSREISTRLSSNEVGTILETLEMLTSGYRNRHDSGRYNLYQPTPPDAVQRLACYSANLVGLCAALHPDDNPIPLSRLMRASDDAPGHWRSTVMLWRATLDSDSLLAVLSSLRLVGDPPSIKAVEERTGKIVHVADLNPRNEILMAQLIGDPAMEWRTRFGVCISDSGYFYFQDGDRWSRALASMMIPGIVGGQGDDLISSPEIIPDPPQQMPDDDARDAARIIFRYLRNGARSREIISRILALLFQLPPVFETDGYTLAALVIGWPELIREFPQLRNGEIYGSAYNGIMIFGDGCGSSRVTKRGALSAS